MAGQNGLRAVARLLNTSPSWLSERLNVRSDPVIFPALEAGRLSLGQATELRRAPAHARRTLLDRLLRDRPSTEVLRSWVKDAKDGVRRAQETNVAALAAGGKREPSSRSYQSLVDQLRTLGTPRSRQERRVLEELGQLVQQLLAQTTGRTGKLRVVGVNAEAPEARTG